MSAEAVCEQAMQRNFLVLDKKDTTLFLVTILLLIHIYKILPIQCNVASASKYTPGKNSGKQVSTTLALMPWN